MSISKILRWGGLAFCVVGSVSCADVSLDNSFLAERVGASRYESRKSTLVDYNTSYMSIEAGLGMSGSKYIGANGGQVIPGIMGAVNAEYVGQGGVAAGFVCDAQHATSSTKNFFKCGTGAGGNGGRGTFIDASAHGGLGIVIDYPTSSTSRGYDDAVSVYCVPLLCGGVDVAYVAAVPDDKSNVVDSAVNKAIESYYVNHISPRAGIGVLICIPGTTGFTCKLLGEVTANVLSNSGVSWRYGGPAVGTDDDTSDPTKFSIVDSLCVRPQLRLRIFAGVNTESGGGYGGVMISFKYIINKANKFKDTQKDGSTATNPKKDVMPEFFNIGFSVIGGYQVR